MISAFQKNRSDHGPTSFERDSILHYSFLIFIDLFDSYRGVYDKLGWFHRKGNNRSFDFSNTLQDLRNLISMKSGYLIDHIFYISANSATPLKLSVTFKDIELYMREHGYINHLAAIYNHSKIKKKIMKRNKLTQLNPLNLVNV